MATNATETLAHVFDLEGVQQQLIVINVLSNLLGGSFPHFHQPSEELSVLRGVALYTSRTHSLPIRDMIRPPRVSRIRQLWVAAKKRRQEPFVVL